MYAYIPDSRRISEPTWLSDFTIVCVCSAVGLMLTGLLFAAGFGGEIGQALIAAG